MSEAELAGAGMELRQAKSIAISAVVTRKDGRIENFNRISYRHCNPIINAVAQPIIRSKRAIGDWWYGRNRSLP